MNAWSSFAKRVFGSRVFGLDGFGLRLLLLVLVLLSFPLGAGLRLVGSNIAGHDDRSGWSTAGTLMLGTLLIIVPLSVAIGICVQQYRQYRAAKDGRHRDIK